MNAPSVQGFFETLMGSSLLASEANALWKPTFMHSYHCPQQSTQPHVEHRQTRRPSAKVAKSKNSAHTMRIDFDGNPTFVGHQL
ncbi:unnamed protein product [Sympodiomycopsis kandeliae]